MEKDCGKIAPLTAKVHLVFLCISSNLLCILRWRQGFLGVLGDSPNQSSPQAVPEGHVQAQQLRAAEIVEIILWHGVSLWRMYPYCIESPRIILYKVAAPFWGCPYYSRQQLWVHCCRNLKPSQPMLCPREIVLPCSLTCGKSRIFWGWSTLKL